MAGPWLKYRGHLDHISDNLLMGATNAFNGKLNLVLNHETNTYGEVSKVARDYKSNGLSSVIVGDENYGEGSSREHAAMEPRYLQVKAVVVRSFARIHETNLKKQGILALTFSNPEDYERIRENDLLDILGLDTFAPGVPLTLAVHHADGTSLSLSVSHSYSALQIEWFKAGSALNYMKKKE
jgi:aconitate hydratase